MNNIILNKNGFLVDQVQVDADFQIVYKGLSLDIDKIIITIDEEFNVGKTKECDFVIDFINGENKINFRLDDMRFNDDEFDINDFMCIYEDHIVIYDGHPLFIKVLNLKNVK